jgi:hypothetical protein
VEIKKNLIDEASMIEDKTIEDMIKTLVSMTPTLHAPIDGKGIVLGNGMPRSKDVALRSQVLADALVELMERRRHMREVEDSIEMPIDRQAPSQVNRP